MKEVASFLQKHRGQIWIETVMYTLIAFVMIGLVLTFARPKIEELQDKAIIDQSITILKNLDIVILDIVLWGQGNQREIKLGIKKGELKIDAINNKIIFEMESAYTYSEPGEIFKDDNLDVYTEQKGNTNIVTLTSDYSESYDIKYGEADVLEVLTKSAVPYKLLFKNEGGETKIIIDISLI